MNQTNLGASKNRERQQTPGHSNIALKALEDSRTHRVTSSFTSKVLSYPWKTQYSILPCDPPITPSPHLCWQNGLTLPFRITYYQSVICPTPSSSHHSGSPHNVTPNRPCRSIR